MKAAIHCSCIWPAPFNHSLFRTIMSQGKIIGVLASILFILTTTKLIGQQKALHPKVLVVIAHPDDESIVSVTLYKIAKEHNGQVDLFVITNGEAGYRYSTLAEKYYGVKLTDEENGRSKLPSIRKQELKNAGHILGVSNYFFADQRDNKYCLDEKASLDSCWNIPEVKTKLLAVLKRENYDFVFCILPGENEHGAHKAATLIALNAVAQLPALQKPVILAATVVNNSDSIIRFSGYKNYTETKVLQDTALFHVDRTASFSYNAKLNYKVITNWEIAEHKTQGATQMTMNIGDKEAFWFFNQNDVTRANDCQSLFQSLAITPK
ncbi:PIG-L family deacetylase [Danxiaibacter flavus]|uniref:PIG-L family deacetylase n=1 Tax=Danxiaibacter flavus TaxID=3049108 RepID=A0ABV3ZIY0_9BACT|nr:PIG-L family deacetylase [Chitinophagaceae bacterium DXS]